MGFFSQAALLKRADQSGPVVILQPSEIEDFYLKPILKHQASVIAHIVKGGNIEVHKTRFSREDTEELINMRVGGSYDIYIKII
tara:strand:- start:1325 stop:1576 length:252 start_codon:yes stop_codon:yes gene_type:complete